MTRRLLRLGPGIKWKLRKLRRETKDKRLAEHCQIVLLAAKRSSQRAIAESVGCHQSRVSRVLKRFREEGVAGLFDRREDNGRPKVDDSFVYVLMSVVSKTPRDFGYLRPTWTLELLVAVTAQQTGVKVHISTLWRVLRMIKARRGRPKPVAICRMPEKAKKRRVAYLRRLAATKNRGEHVFYVDAVDIHLNPKIGPDWMLPGQQKQVVTPGKNQNCYMAGALDARTQKLIWTGGTHKNSGLFLSLVRELLELFPKAKRIHLILDNFKIHNSKQTQQFLRQLRGRVRLHFLPPYCPDENRIERVWRDLHDNVTHNHQCRSMDELVGNVLRYLEDRNSRGSQGLTRIAA
ncbi:MAG: IS630 orf protein [Pirellulaceae bacterium]|nr:MAG: IS630 orf protein [Pirellulaceae bacterium]